MGLDAATGCELCGDRRELALRDFTLTLTDTAPHCDKCAGREAAAGQGGGEGELADAALAGDFEGDLAEMEAFVAEMPAAEGGAGTGPDDAAHGGGRRAAGREDRAGQRVYTHQIHSWPFLSTTAWECTSPTAVMGRLPDPGMSNIGRLTAG